ncbi:MAG TPA: MSMEG_1061 family FMN-dependent PPOX-type flavoprotein [Terriglobales bacterium]|nr:MSMEG_1061 family FMN-dependent PPOX-type flavoprotein [Terriglobales bacterium]
MEIVRWMSLTFDEIRSPNRSLCLVSEGLKSMVALRKVLTAGSTEVTLLDADAARILIEGFVPPSTLVTSSVLDHIDAHMRHFIEASPLCFISSADADGVQEVSPRGDPQGSFKVLNERTLAIADRPGNNRIDTLKNMLVNPQLGLIFVIPGVEETLRISGLGCISVDLDLLSSMSVQNRAPRLAIIVEVRKAHLHCAKAFRRSRVWEKDSQVPRNMLPSFATMIADQVKLSEQKRLELEARIDRSNTENLWEQK